MIGLNTQQSLFPACWLCMNLCIDCCPLQKRIFSDQVKSSNMCIFEHKYLEDNLRTCIFYKKTVVSHLHLGRIFLATGSVQVGLQYKAWILCCGTDLKSNQNALGYPHNMHTTILRMDSSCLAAKCYISIYHWITPLMIFFSSSGLQNTFQHCES